MEKPVLILNPLQSSDENTNRIFNLTNEAVERLNIFVDDFFNTFSILNENLTKAQSKNDSEKISEIEESLSEINIRIDEIKEDMSQMLRDLPQLITIKYQ